MRKTTDEIHKFLETFQANSLAEGTVFLNPGLVAGGGEARWKKFFELKLFSTVPPASWKYLKPSKIPTFFQVLEFEDIKT